MKTVPTILLIDSEKTEDLDLAPLKILKKSSKRRLMSFSHKHQKK